MPSREETVLEICTLLVQHVNMRLKTADCGIMQMALQGRIRLCVDVMRGGMTNELKYTLVVAVMDLFTGIDLPDAMTGLSLVLENDPLKKALLQRISIFFKEKMNYEPY